jgi:HK97 family phage major capsid protein
MQVVNVAALERDLDKKKAEAAALLGKTAKECQAHEEKDADGKTISTGRLMTEAERGAIQKIIDEANGIKAKLAAAKSDEALAQQIDKLTAGMTRIDAEETRRVVIKSLGQQWVDSEPGKYFFDKKHRGSRVWNSGIAELFRPDVQATTITEDPSSGGKLIVPQYLPGIVPLPTRPLTVRQLLASGTATSNLIIYMKETTFTNAAAAVAEGAAKPESAIAFDQAQDPVVKLAHWIPVSEEMLEDVPQIRSYIDARLLVGLGLTEEDQLLNGSGVAPNMTGILNRAGLTAPYARVDPMTNADAIYVQMMTIFWTSFVMPDGHVINPTNWANIALSKDTLGRYLAGGPFSTLLPPTLWGLPVAITPAIVANTALTGAFGSMAQVFETGGIRVEASNSHQDFFVKNLVALRAEERLALCVYRPSAFGKTTGLNGQAPIPLAAGAGAPAEAGSGGKGHGGKHAAA